MDLLFLFFMWALLYAWCEKQLIMPGNAYVCYGQRANYIRVQAWPDGPQVISSYLDQSDDRYGDSGSFCVRPGESREGNALPCM